MIFELNALRSPLESQFVIKVGDLLDGASLQDLGPNRFSLWTNNIPGEQTTKNVFILGS